MMPPANPAPCPACHGCFGKTTRQAFRGIWHIFLGVLFLTHSHVFSQAPANEIKLGLPIDCVPGQDCHVLAYVDKLPGPEFADVGGGRQTYDGHDGTDFGVVDEAVIKKGVAVKAAAAGTVVRVRDGVADQRVENNLAAQAISQIGCGNAVVIEHPDNWRTTYCHLRKGSLAVKAGMTVAKGATLGLVGLSGLTSYPHVHFGVRHRGKTIDPFTGSPPGHAAQEAARPLWETPLLYAEAGLISSGFSNQKPHINAVWQGAMSTQSLTTESDVIFFWAHPFGVLPGDVEQFRLLDPGGVTAAAQSSLIAQANRINRVSAVALRRSPEMPLSKGIWQGHYQLRRGDKLLIDIRRQIEVEAP